MTSKTPRCLSAAISCGLRPPPARHTETGTAFGARKSGIRAGLTPSTLQWCRCGRCRGRNLAESVAVRRRFRAGVGVFWQTLTKVRPCAPRLGPGTPGEPVACAPSRLRRRRRRSLPAARRHATRRRRLSPGGLRLRKGSGRGLQTVHGRFLRQFSSACRVDRRTRARPARRPVRMPCRGSRGLPGMHRHTSPRPHKSVTNLQHFV